MNLEQAFETFLQENQLIAPTDRILVAVSGGVDSMVLAHLVRQSNQKFGIAHCNFRLRGAASDADEQFVRDLANAWEVPVYIHHFDTKKYAEENGISVQMAARELRYTWFEIIRESADFTHIATGHNLNDSVETCLLNLMRGTGITGLGGIPVQNGHVIRPLLFATREAILAYAHEKNIQWREDSSNAKDDYTRNAIRRHVLPKLTDLNPAFLTAASTTMRHLRDADKNLQFLLSNFIGTPDANGVFHLPKSKLATLPALQSALFDFLQPLEFTADQVQQVVECWGQTGTEWQSTSGYRLIMDRDEILLTNVDRKAAMLTISKDDLMVRMPDGGSLVIMHLPSVTEFPDDPKTIMADSTALRFPLHLRRWEPGDTFQPLGMGGNRQKLQDFFTNQKLSKLEKEQAWILADDEGRIVWIVGMRLDERFKITASTDAYLKISWVT
ncbi:MAG: tRNA lysidine(34) synthetase TilS [Lewinellaceae bacterium]|nr:tRNA lysidine(34) synthetase TilS [Saprospiraceae bacterium]MCB9330369.1 tRNA lysidine(34) synthetase TilS [Lewinellaceae bacterium]